MFEERQKYQIFASLAANLCQHAVGHCVPMSAYILPQLTDDQVKDSLLLNSNQASWFASIFVVGCLTGSVIGGLQSDWLGRRWSMMLDCVLMALGFILVSTAPNIELLLLGRLLTGHSAGSNLVSSPIFVSEISHPDLRGTLSVLTMVCYTSGFFLSMLAGAALQWRIATGVFVLTPILSFSLLAFCKESPSWLLRQGKEDLAMTSLLFYRGNPEECKEELKKMKKHIQSSTKTVTLKQQLISSLHSISKTEFLKPFLLMNLILTFGLEWAGFPALAFYMHSILKQMDIPLDEYWVAVGLAGYRSFLTVALSFVLYKARRRPVYLAAGSLVFLSTASLSTYNLIIPTLDPSLAGTIRFLPLISVLLMYTGFGIGYGPIVFLLQGEIFPSDIRSLSCGLLGVIDNVSLFVAVKVVPILISSLGIGGAFMVYSLCCLSNLIVCFFVMPETKGLSLEEIEDFYKKRERKISITC